MDRCCDSRVAGLGVALVTCLLHACDTGEWRLPELGSEPPLTILESAAIDNAQLFAQIKVFARADGTSEVTTLLKAGGNSSHILIRLSEGDVLTAESDGETQTMVEDFVDYHTTFDGIEAGKQFTVRLTRAEQATLTSSGALPEPFELTAPMPQQEVSRADDVNVRWSPTSGDDAMWVFIGDCTTLWRWTIEGDPGAATIPAGGSPHGNHGTSTCDTELMVHRERSGDIDPGFGTGGRFDAVQERSVPIRSTP